MSSTMTLESMIKKVKQASQVASTTTIIDNWNVLIDDTYS